MKTHADLQVDAVDGERFQGEAKQDSVFPILFEGWRDCFAINLVVTRAFGPSDRWTESSTERELNAPRHPFLRFTDARHVVDGGDR